MTNVTKVCRVCKQERPITEFYRNKNNTDGRRNDCRDCAKITNDYYYQKDRDQRAEYSREYYRKERDRIIAYQKAWSATETGKRVNRASLLRRKYGITLEHYERMLEEQNGVCAICGQPEISERYERLCVDHCHRTGAIRGLLCSDCNRGLGLLGDDIERLNQAVNYLSSRYINQTNNKTT